MSSKSDHMLCRKTRLNKFKRNEIIQRVFSVMVEQKRIKNRKRPGEGGLIGENYREENTKIIRKYLEKKGTARHSKSLGAAKRELCSVNVSAPKGRSPINTLTRHRLNKPNLGEQVKEIINFGVELIEQETGKNRQKQAGVFEEVSNGC